MHAEGHAVAHAVEHPHPGPATYILIAVVLTAITIAEVGAIWPTLPFAAILGGLVVPFLLVLSAAKFSLVVMFYMHLKFDSRVFTGFFVAGLLIAISVIIALLALLQADHPPGGTTPIAPPAPATGTAAHGSPSEPVASPEYLAPPPLAG